MAPRVRAGPEATGEVRPESESARFHFLVTRDGLRLGALVLICYATTARLGNFNPLGLGLLFAAIALMLISLFTPRATPPSIPRLVLVVSVLLVMLLQYPRNYAQEFDPAVFWPFTGLAMVAAVGSVVLWQRRRFALPLVAILGCADLALIAGSLKRNWGGPPIDVFDVQQRASQALLHGTNPYAPLIDQFAGNGITPGHAVPAHFPYGPSIILADMPARLLGDIRLTHLAAAAVLLGVLVILGRRGASGRELLIAVLWLASPLTVGMVENGWIDIITMAGFGGWLVLRRCHRWWAIALLAAAVAAKPIFLPALIPVFLWSRAGRREIMVAGGVALLIILPFAVATGFGQFYDDVIGFHVSREPRYDSLTVTSFLRLNGYPSLPVIVAGAITLVISGLSLVRRPRDQGDMLTAGAIICTIAFLMFKQAFFNYYFISAVLLIMAVASRQTAFDERIEV